MKIMFKCEEDERKPMRYVDVMNSLEYAGNVLRDLGTSGRLRIHNKAMNELGRKTVPIEEAGENTSDRLYQTILNARAILKEVEETLGTLQTKENVLYQERCKRAQQAGGKGNKQFTLRCKDLLPSLIGSFLGIMLGTLLRVLCGM